jgi:hypothetical protein
VARCDTVDGWSEGGGGRRAGGGRRGSVSGKTASVYGLARRFPEHVANRRRGERRRDTRGHLGTPPPKGCKSPPRRSFACELTFCNAQSLAFLSPLFPSPPPAALLPQPSSRSRPIIRNVNIPFRMERLLPRAAPDIHMIIAAGFRRRPPSLPSSTCTRVIYAFAT